MTSARISCRNVWPRWVMLITATGGPSHAFDVIHTRAEFTSINQPADHDSQAAR